MMWVLFALSLLELLAIHLFVALKWPLIGWPLTIISGLGAVAILFWIRSFRTHPHALSDGRLHLRFGSLKAIDLDLSNIARVRRGWEQGALEGRGIVNLAGIAYPNRCIELCRPIKKGCNRVFVLLDEPDTFDQALVECGIAIE